MNTIELEYWFSYGAGDGDCITFDAEVADSLYEKLLKAQEAGVEELFEIEDDEVQKFVEDTIDDFHREAMEAYDDEEWEELVEEYGDDPISEMVTDGIRFVW